MAVAYALGPAPRYSPRNRLRFVTAAALFDGHDAAINVMRRVLQASGAEVIHLGHNRGAQEIVNAAIQEDAQAIAVSSYQGGHVEFFKYMFDLLREKNAGHIRIYGGGGGVIVPREVRELHEYGIDRIFTPEDGRELGLQGMIDVMLQGADFATVDQTGLPSDIVHHIGPDAHGLLARLISLAELGWAGHGNLAEPLRRAGQAAAQIPVIGMTGTGGAGKSSLTDELILRFLRALPQATVGVISVDPTRQKSGGALLGDRIRMNSLASPRVYQRSLATRSSGSELSAATADAVAILRAAKFDVIFVETSGIGQAASGIREIAGTPIYVMTPEFGAPTQLEKIDMLDYADFVAVNKFDRRAAKDALRDVRKQIRRNRNLSGAVSEKDLGVFGTIASQFNDPGVNGLFVALIGRLESQGFPLRADTSVLGKISYESEPAELLPPGRERYLAEIAAAVRKYHKATAEQVQAVRDYEALRRAAELAPPEVRPVLRDCAEVFAQKIAPETRKSLEEWPVTRRNYSGDEHIYEVRGREIRTPLATESLAGTRIKRVALPPEDEPGALVRYLREENLPGQFPFTAGVFPFKRADEAPKRQFAGEGTPDRTNKRFHFLCEGEAAKRLSVAFDSVTLYGEDPHERPDIYGKVGESGVSVCTLDDMKRLFEGFDLCAANTSVSMTINGPAPIILAMYFNTAIDQRMAAFARQHGRSPREDEAAQIRADTLANVRGTVQADILKEDQAQNTCIFSTGFALKMMGDIQSYFLENHIRNYYSVSISGYHIAEAGANPISQLAFTLANGFTYAEYYRARGMAVDGFAPNLSFFFSNGMDAEYTVLGRVARRIWAIAMRDLYGAGERSQKLKYHIQTSGRSLHAQEVDFNDIRTTLQALLAIYDNCNSLHTNAFDEAVTTPTENSVRRAMAIQMILAQEMGLAKNENPWQGSYIVEELTQLVEEAVLAEFERLADRGGVLGAMETQYQRAKIQEESLLYETRKHDGSLPIIGTNTYVNPKLKDSADAALDSMELARASPEEKQLQLRRVREFQARHQEACPQALAKLQQAAAAGGNIFAELMHTVRVASLGQIAKALYETGGEYRRAM